MAAASTIIAVAAVIGAGATVVSAVEAGKAADTQKERTAQSQARNTAEAAKSRRENLRRLRTDQASIEAQGAASGTAASSASLGIADTLAAQTASSTASTGARLSGINADASLQSSIADSQARQATFQAIGGFASSAFSVAAGTKSGQAAIGNVIK